MKKGTVAMLILSLMGSAQAADIDAGKEKATVCAACHGANGISVNPEWPNLAGQGEKYLRKQLHDFKSGERANAVMVGQAAMLSEEDIDNLAAYFASLDPAPAATSGAGENPDEMLALGEKLYRGGNMERGIPACAACHGPTGAGIEPAAFPVLSAQHVKYTRNQLQAFQAAAGNDDLATDSPVPTALRGNDPNQMMRGIAKHLTPKEMEAVAYYVQGLN